MSQLDMRHFAQKRDKITGNLSEFVTYSDHQHLQLRLALPLRSDWDRRKAAR